MGLFERLKGLAGGGAERLASIRGALLGEVRGNAGPVDLGGEATVVLVFDELVPELSQPGPLLVCAASPSAATGLPEHDFVALDDPQLSQSLLAHLPTRVVVASLGSARLRPLAAALRAGATRVHFAYAPGMTFEASPTGALALTGWRETERAAAEIPLVPSACERGAGWRLAPEWPTTRSSEHAAEEIVAAAGVPRDTVPQTGAIRVCNYIGSLASGGAERQLTYTAAALVEDGHQVSVLTALPLVGDDAHYAPGLRRDGAQVRALDDLAIWRSMPGELSGALSPPLLEALDRHAARAQLVPLVDRFRAERPHVVHGWLDEPNLVGALAALVAGVPRIVVSTWSINPTYYPAIHKPWFRAAYRELASCERVAFVANSRAGGDDYADWLGIARERFQVLPNGLSTADCAPLGEEAIRSGREALGIAPDAFVVAGLFRLSPEKRPHDFVEALALAHERLPGLRGIHMGGGQLAEDVVALAARRGLEDSLLFLGRTEEPWDYLGLADVSLLASEVEGSPNVSQESQAQEVPILLTRVFGSPETVIEDETGFLFEVGDVQGMADCLVRLAEGRARLADMGRAGRAFVEREFSLAAMQRRALRLYRTGRVAVDPEEERRARPSD